MTLNHYSKVLTRRTAALILTLATPLCMPLLAQGPKLTVAPLSQVSVKRGATATVKLTATLNEGFHANSHTPNDESLIPLKLTWEPGPLVANDVAYPKPQMEKYEFSDKPLSVVTGTFDLVTKFTAGADAPAGPAMVTGKLRYQACSNNACFPPKTVEVHVPVMVQ